MGETTLWSVPDLKTFLRGSWQVDRSLLDRRHSISGEFHGQARFAPARMSLIYHELGRLQFGAHLGSAEQFYRYEFDATNARAIVRFRDGRLFHELDLSSGEALVAHACEPDLYEGRFTVIGPTQWKSAWKVAGPRKEQEIMTLYTRLS